MVENEVVLQPMRLRVDRLVPHSREDPIRVPLQDRIPIQGLDPRYLAKAKVGDIVGLLGRPGSKAVSFYLSDPGDGDLSWLRRKDPDILDRILSAWRIEAKSLGSGFTEQVTEIDTD